MFVNIKDKRGKELSVFCLFLSLMHCISSDHSCLSTNLTNTHSSGVFGSSWICLPGQDSQETRQHPGSPARFLTSTPTPHSQRPKRKISTRTWSVGETSGCHDRTTGAVSDECWWESGPWGVSKPHIQTSEKRQQKTFYQE